MPLAGQGWEESSGLAWLSTWPKTGENWNGYDSYDNDVYYELLWYIMIYYELLWIIMIYFELNESLKDNER